MKHILRTAVLCMAAFLGLSLSAAAQQQKADPADQVREVADRIFNYLDGCTPYTLVDGKGKVLSDLSKIDKETSFSKSDFSITHYEWGVVYSGMLAMGDVLGDEKYTNYTMDRFNALGAMFPYIKEYYETTGYEMKPQLQQIYVPRFLDDCGSGAAALIKGALKNPWGNRGFRNILDHWFNFVMYKEYRLGDGLLARNRPTTNSVWLDDMYMGIPAIAYRARLMQVENGDLTEKYFNEAVKQILGFKKYLWIPEKNLFRHGWIEGMSEHPNFHWARANGWAMLTMCDVLDVLPPSYAGYDEIMSLLKAQIKGVAALQAPDGRWHQLLDRSESYLETSASAMFVYCIAHAINKGWIDKTAYQDVAKSGWKGVAAQVNEKGQVENTCVGTGFGWTNTFYESRPVSVLAAHGYGPMLLAASEMLKIYGVVPPAPQGFGFFGMMPPQQPQQPVRQAPEAPKNPERVKGKPMVILAGDSTTKTGNGTGQGNQWGWGSYFADYLTDGVTVENDGSGGRSSRTYYNTVWTEIRNGIQKGDFVFINFGHNDPYPLGTGRARGTLNGTGEEMQTVTMERNGGPEDVYTYGHYIRMMVRQAKMRGAHVIVMSPSSKNTWEGENKVARFTDTYTAWSRQVAEEEGVEFIDLNELTSKAMEEIGRTVATREYFAGGVHTTEKGARMYDQIICEQLKAHKSPLAKYVK